MPRLSSTVFHRPTMDSAAAVATAPSESAAAISADRHRIAVVMLISQGTIAWSRRPRGWYYPRVNVDTPRSSLPLAAFRARSFRFQWPADLLTSWANEMEILILAWYVLVRTDSVLLLTLFGSLQQL